MAKGTILCSVVNFDCVYEISYKDKGKYTLSNSFSLKGKFRCMSLGYWNDNEHVFIGLHGIIISKTIIKIFVYVLYMHLNCT